TPKEWREKELKPRRSTRSTAGRTERQVRAAPMTDRRQSWPVPPISDGSAEMGNYSELNGKVAIITGASRPQGLGAAIARRLAAEGCRIVIHDIGTPGTSGLSAEGLGTNAEM